MLFKKLKMVQNKDMFFAITLSADTWTKVTKQLKVIQIFSLDNNNERIRCLFCTFFGTNLTTQVYTLILGKHTSETRTPDRLQLGTQQMMLLLKLQQFN